MCICVTLFASWLCLFFHCWKAHELSKMEHWAILVCFQDAWRRESVEFLLEFVKVSLKPSSSHLAKLYSSHLIIIIYIYNYYIYTIYNNLSPLFIGFAPHCGCWNNCVYLIVTLCLQFDQAFTVIRITSAQIHRFWCDQMIKLVLNATLCERTLCEMSVRDAPGTESNN